MRQNIIISVLVAISLALAGVTNAVMDTLVFHYGQSVFPQGDEKLLGGTVAYWNPTAESWKNKYAQNADGTLIEITKKPWYYLGLYQPSYKEAFPYSATALVFLTDGWHLFQFLMLTLMQLAIAMPLIKLWRLKWWWVFAALLPMKVVFGVVFTLFFSRVLKRRSAA